MAVAPVKVANGSQACVVGTEHTIYSLTTNNNVILDIQLPATATANDVFMLTVYKKLASDSDTLYITDSTTIAGCNSVIQYTPLDPICAVYDADYRIKQVTGANTTVVWSVNAIGG